MSNNKHNGNRTKKNVTLSIDEQIHRDFKVEATMNDNDMSMVVENFMISYIKASKQLREERMLKKYTNE